MSKIKHRFVVINRQGHVLEKLPSRLLPVGVVAIGQELLLRNGVCYRVVRVVLDLEIPSAELHVELLKEPTT